MIKNLPAKQETRVWSLGREDPLEKGMATHFSILTWRIPWTEESLVGRSPWDGKELDTTEWLSFTHSLPWSESHSWNSPGKNTGVGRLFLLQGIFPTQGSNPGLLQCRWSLYQLSHEESPRILEWIVCFFSSRSSWSRNKTKVSWISGEFFTNWANWVIN